MKTLSCWLLLWTAAFAHPEGGMPAGKALEHAVQTGNAEWKYEAVPHWGELPNDEPIGPTHGGVLVDDESGKIYVSTDAIHSILVYRNDGTLEKTIAPECRGFHAMAIRKEDGKSVIYGAQLNSNQPPLRVCKLDLNGNLLLEIPNQHTGEVPGGWKGLTAVAVAPDGTIFAAMGYGSNLIHRFDPQGKWLSSFGGKGEDEKLFNRPHGLGMDMRFDPPRLLVADREKRRLVHFDLLGNWIGVHAKDLRRPCAVAFFGDHLAVAELEARVTLLNKEGVPVAFLGDNADQAQWANFKVPKSEQRLGIFTAPHGLAFDRLGNLYVQDWNETGRITKLEKQ
ncbi:MAG: hypothetical protein EAZ42_13495 [Verrucomicrobia bacterium]|nr:MAG: hypothetical protein EAZ42_13495 [Verrucomicrobiota bacterium]